MTKYEFPADIDNFTGAPADQDAACRRMIVAGLEWQDAHPEFPPKFFASGAVGLLSDLHDAVLAASPSVGFWVKRIAHRMSINRHVRSRRERQANDSEMGNEPHLFVDDVDQPLDILIAREEADAVRAGIASLKDLDRQTLDDYYLNHLTIKEIAAKEHTFIGTVKRRLHTARLRLRAVLPSDICEGGDAEWRRAHASR